MSNIEYSTLSNCPWLKIGDRNHTPTFLNILGYWYWFRCIEKFPCRIVSYSVIKPSLPPEKRVAGLFSVFGFSCVCVCVCLSGFWYPLIKRPIMVGFQRLIWVLNNFFILKISTWYIEAFYGDASIDPLNFEIRL